MLDSDENQADGNAFDSIQGQWLQNALSASTAQWKIVLLHLTPYSSESSGIPANDDHGPHPIVQWPYEAWGADAVIAGHDHIYERLHFGTIPYLVNGVGGRSVRTPSIPIISETQTRFSSDFGAMKLMADATSLTFEFYSVEAGSTLIDTVTLSSTNTAPTIVATPTQNNAEGDTVSLAVSANDLDGTLSYSATGLPSSVTIDPVSGAISGTINFSAAVSSPYDVTVSINDGFYTVKSNFVWNVSDVPIPDILAPDIPANFTATPISDTQIDLSWDASGG